MGETKQIVSDRIRELPEQLRSYILAENWRGAIEKIAAQYNLDREKMAALENEMFFVLLCFNPTKDLFENIKKEVGLDDDKARKITDNINGSVLSPVMKDIKSIWENILTETVVQKTPEPDIKPYDSFEQTILRQAQAMKPASGPTPTKQIEPVKKYPAGNDPYREAPE